MINGYGCASMNGFSLHAATAVKAHERDRLEKLLRYVGRGALSNDRFSLDDEGNVLYKLKNSYDDASHILLSPLELLEKISGIIPPPKRHQITYYGCLSSHSRIRPLIVPSKRDEPGKKESDAKLPSTAENEGTDSRDKKEVTGNVDKKKNSNYISWAELLKRSYKIDITLCRKCGGRLRVISMIREADTIRKILDFLGLGADPPVARPSSYCTEDFLSAWLCS